MPCLKSRSSRVPAHTVLQKKARDQPSNMLRESPARKVVDTFEIAAPSMPAIVEPRVATADLS